MALLADGKTNLSDVFQRWPSGAARLMEYHDVLLRRQDSPLTIADRELIAAYASGINTCAFCQGAHTVIAEQFGVSADLIETLCRAQGISGDLPPSQAIKNAHEAINETSDSTIASRAAKAHPEDIAACALLEPAQLRAVLKLCAVLVLRPTSARDRHRAECLDAGVTADQVHEAIMVTSLFAMMNRMVEGHGVETSLEAQAATRARHKVRWSPSPRASPAKSASFGASLSGDVPPLPPAMGGPAPSDSSAEGQPTADETAKASGPPPIDRHTYVGYGKTIGVLPK